MVWICLCFCLHPHLMPFSLRHSYTGILQILQWANLFPFSGPFHIVFLLPGMLRPQTLNLLDSDSLLGFSSTVPSSENSSLIPTPWYTLFPHLLCSLHYSYFSFTELAQLLILHITLHLLVPYFFPLSILCDACEFNHSPNSGKIFSKLFRFTSVRVTLPFLTVTPPW